MAPGKTNRRARASQASPWELKRSGASQGNPGDLSDTSALYEGEKHRLRWAWDLAFFYIPLTDDRDVCEDQEPFGAGLVHVLLGSSWVPQGTAPALCQAVPVFCPQTSLAAEQTPSPCSCLAERSCWQSAVPLRWSVSTVQFHPFTSQALSPLALSLSDSPLCFDC